MSALTEIYVDNVTRHLPEDSRPDIAAEITATIDDMVDARLGEDADTSPDHTAAVEREVLEELGDPVALSRSTRTRRSTSSARIPTRSSSGRCAGSCPSSVCSPFSQTS